MDSILEQINSMGNVFVDFALPMLIQSNVLIVFLLGLDLMLRKRIRAVFRYWIWMIVLAKLVLPTTLSSPTSPVYWFGDNLSHLTKEGPVIAEIPADTLPSTNLSVETRTPVEHLPEVSPITSDPTFPGQVEPVEAGYAASPTVSSTSMTWRGFVFLAWLVVVSIMVLLLIQRTFFVRRLIAQSVEPGAEMLHIFEQAREQIPVRRRPALRLSHAVVSPSVCGLFRPTILIPERLADQLDSRHLRSILLHELAHVKRGDLWISLLQTLLQIFYIYHPLLWVANAMIRKIRETAVDETVLVAMGERAEEYPRTLLNVSKLTFGRSALSLQLIGVVESKKALAGRIKHITSRPFPKTAKLGMAGLLSISIIAAVLLPMAKAGKGETVSTVSTFEGRLEFHKPLAVGMSAGTAEYPELVRIEWIRFEKNFANAWSVTGHIGWLPVEDTTWRIKVELLDEKDQILQHSRDGITVFTTLAGETNRTTMTHADLNLDTMLDQGRIPATRFRIHLERLNEQDNRAETIDSETRTLEIVVVDRENKTPVADAVVIVGRSYVQGTHRRERTVYTTDLNGRRRVRLTNKKLSAIYLSVQKPGFATIRRSWSNSGSSLVGRMPLVNLPSRDVIEMARGISMGGIVQDAEGNPVEGVDVHFQARMEESIGGVNFDRMIYHIVQTDGNGRWRVERIHPNLSYVSLELRHADYGGDNVRNQHLTDEQLIDARALRHVGILEKGLILTGRVLDKRGSPVVRATVKLNLRSLRPLYALTDASGRFRLVCTSDRSAYRELPTLIVEAPGYAPVQQIIDLQPKPEGFEFHLTRGRDITCRVINRTGEPIVGGWTVVEPFPEGVRYGVWLKDTDEHGEFQVPNVPQDNVRLTVGKEGYITIRDYVVTPSERKVVITMQNTLRLSGTVTDAETGKPIPHFDIEMVGKGNRFGSPIAFTKGTYELNIDEMSSESLELRVSAVGYGIAHSEDIRVDEGSRVINFKLTKDPLFDTKSDRREYGQARPTDKRIVMGVVRDDKDEPISGAFVTTYPILAEETITDTEGAFTLQLRTTNSLIGGMGRSRTRPETSILFVRHKERNLAGVIELDDDAETVEMTLTPGVILSGRVIDVEGHRIPGTKISLMFWNSNSGYPNREVTKIDDEGYYQIRAVPSGHRYSVMATAEGYGQPSVDVHTDETGNRQMDLEPLVLEVANLSVSGVVVDIDGRPVAGAKVSASGRGQPNHFDILTDLQGRFKIEGVCAGPIRLWANSGQRKHLYGSAETEGGVTDVEIVAIPRGMNKRSKPTR